MTDTTIWKIGKYKSKMVGHLPAQYLFWFESELKNQNSPFAKEFKEYIEDNRQVLNQEIEEEKRNNKFY